MLVKIADIIHKAIKVNSDMSKIPILFIGHSIDGNIDSINTCIEERPNFFRSEQIPICGRINIFDITAFFSVTDHVSKSSMQQRLTFFIKTKHFKWLLELF